MNIISIPFEWDFNISPIAIFQFPVDLSRLKDESNSMSEFPCFMINLNSGELIGVSEEIATGDAYIYEISSSWIVEGKDWWLGYNESTDESYSQFQGQEVGNSINELLNSKSGFVEIVNLVCDLARNKDLREFKMDGLYQKYIDNEDSPSL